MNRDTTFQDSTCKEDSVSEDRPSPEHPAASNSAQVMGIDAASDTSGSVQGLQGAAQAESDDNIGDQGTDDSSKVGIGVKVTASSS